MMYTGFTGVCEEFVTWHGGSGHYIVPIRINGSSIESLFSRVKYNANGNLSAVNYESAMTRLLTANAVSHTNKDDEYRSNKLNVIGDLKH